MTVKEQIVKAVQELPSDASYEDAMERLYLLQKIEKGMNQVDSGQGVPHEDVKTRLEKWLK